MFADAHCHAHMLDNIEEELSKAKAANVGLIFSNSIDFESMRKNIELSRKFPQIKALLGIHPEEVIKMNANELNSAFEFIEENIKNCVGIGETGLDYKYAETSEQRGMQKECFLRHIEIATNHSLPIVVHSRRAQNDALDLLEKNHAEKVLLHWFYANTKTLERAIKLGYYISVGPSILSNNSLWPMLKKYPLERILFETDCPAVVFEGQRVDFTWIPKVAKKLAEIREIPLEEIETLSENALKELFR